MNASAPQKYRCSDLQAFGVNLMGMMDAAHLHQDWMFVGDIRRELPFVSEIDIVMLPGYDRHHMARVFKTHMGAASYRKGYARCHIRGSLVEPNGNHHLHIQVVNMHVVEPDVWGSTVFLLTGSPEYVKQARDVAQRRWGILLRKDGVWKNGHKIAGVSERSVFMALGLSWKDPDKRYLTEDMYR